ncbi:MAG TPA: N-acetylmuramoyl-L-alanine amidase, partial [Chloroflexia bacterium]|nr:N-acetylmuramoyl-L-alanine amidase [Chloroflexia bacterium]
YFERAVFELHPENAAPYDILLSQLGSFQYRQKYPSGAPGQHASPAPGAQLFAATGKRVGGAFLAYWQAHGGLAQQGYPISEEFTETSDLDGHPYTVQYFERAVFERHPENAPPYDILLSQLGTLRYQQHPPR